MFTHLAYFQAKVHFCGLNFWELFLKWANPGLFFVYFRSFQTNNTILQQMNVKNVMSIQYPAPGFKPTTFGT